MAALENARHERFAQARFKGLTIDAAYAEAGFKPHSSNAARLSGNDSVRRRIAELQEGAAEACEETVEKLTNELNQALVFAMEEKRADRVAVVVMAKAKLHGLIIEKSEATVTHRHEERLSEVQAILAQRRKERAGDGPSPVH